MTASAEHMDGQMGTGQFQNYFFIGIGGIGMSALARYFHTHGKKVVGYDRTPSDLISDLVRDGIEVHFEDEIHQIPEYFAVENTQVVYTPAIPGNHVQYNHFLENGYNIKKRSRVLGDITLAKHTIAVAGTHGKTTTSTMIAHMLKECGKNVTAFLGGISTNYATNYLQGKDDESEIVVVEADEFDRSFLTLFPNTAVITSVEADHLDIYGTGSMLEESFLDFAKQVSGSVFIQSEFARGFSSKWTYGIEQGDLQATEPEVENMQFVFDVTNGKETIIHGIKLDQPGYHNVENALGAISVGLELQLDVEKIRNAFTTYKGVKRRFEWKIKQDDLVLIDDYAHHPTEIRQFIKSVKKLIPGKKLTVIFQPHLYSRTRDFAAGFSESLSLADEVILLEIYPARELPIPGVNSEMLLKNIKCPGIICSREELGDKILEMKPEVVATLGAGDIDRLVEPLKQKLLMKYA